MRKFKLKGDSSNEKFAHIERTLQHFSRRLTKNIVGIIPPSPIFSFIPHPMEDGTILNCALPAKGNITRGVMVVGSFATKNLVEINCEISRKSGGLKQRFETRKNVQVLDISLDVEVGDVLTISTPEPKFLENWIMEKIWITLLYDIDIKHARIKNILLDELDRISDEGIREHEDSTEPGA